MEMLIKLQENCEKLMISQERVQWMEEVMKKHGIEGDRELGDWYWREAWSSFYRHDFNGHLGSVDSTDSSS